MEQRSSLAKTLAIVRAPSEAHFGERHEQGPTIEQP